MMTVERMVWGAFVLTACAGATWGFTIENLEAAYVSMLLGAVCTYPLLRSFTRTRGSEQQR